MQVIKQGVHAPQEVSKQVAIIYAGVNGFLDDLPVDKVLAFEQALHDALDSHFADFVKAFDEAKALTDDIKSQLENVIQKVRESFSDDLKKESKPDGKDAPKAQPAPEAKEEKEDAKKEGKKET